LETLEALVAAGDLVEARSARFKISEAAHARLDEARATAEQTERRVRDHFSELVARCCPTSDSDVLWHDFNDHLLIPLIKVSAFN